jgi:hypothetical protein
MAGAEHGSAQGRLVQGHRVLCPSARTIGVVSLTITRWPPRVVLHASGDLDLHHQRGRHPLRLGGLADWAQPDAPLGHCLDTLTAVAERERLPTAPGFERVGVVRSVGVFKTREQRPARLRVEPGGGGRAGSGSYAVRGR